MSPERLNFTGLAPETLIEIWRPKTWLYYAAVWQEILNNKVFPVSAFKQASHARLGEYYYPSVTWKEENCLELHHDGAIYVVDRAWCRIYKEGVPMLGEGKNGPESKALFGIAPEVAMARFRKASELIKAFTSASDEMGTLTRELESVQNRRDVAAAELREYGIDVSTGVVVFCEPEIKEGVSIGIPSL